MRIPTDTTRIYDMRIPKSEFTDADLKLCRAHGDAVFEHYPMPAFTADESARFKAAAAYRTACDDFERVTLDQAQSDAYWQWQHEVHAPMTIGVDMGNPGGDSAVVTLAPAKPANPEPCQAPKSAQTEQTHSVCIKAHGFADWQVGEIRPVHRNAFARPNCWLPCDSQGWITHIPTADSVCPVPDGVQFEARYGDGLPVASPEYTRTVCTILWCATNGSVPSNDIVAWRPTGPNA